MTRMQSFDIEKDSNGHGMKASPIRNPYGPGGDRSAANSPMTTARTYFIFCLALIAIYGLGKLMLPTDNTNEHGGAAGGWGSDHNHPIVSHESKTMADSTTQSNNGSWNTPVTHYHEEKNPKSYSYESQSNYNKEHAELEIRESDLLMMLSPLVFIPSHHRPEYEKYQSSSDANSINSAGESSYSEDVLYDKQTPHGMAFDFMLNRDKRPVNSDDPHLVQRFVLTLLFYTTGGKDVDPSSPSSTSTAEGGDSGRIERRSGWDSSMAHFLTGLHECHWVKKSLEDQFWGILSIENDNDRRVGVTKCNADMEVTEIRLGKFCFILIWRVIDLYCFRPV